jgi:hypothetical protein
LEGIECLTGIVLLVISRVDDDDPAQVSLAPLAA